jgi:hypothetical protein
MRHRNVVVAMPFGRPGAERRKAILNFRRLKYIIENKCQVVPQPASTTRVLVAYDVDVARTPMDEIPKNALKRIYDADILIVLLSGRNFTVAYELGYRRARESETPVILMVDSKDDLPIYESAVAYQSWKQDDVLGQIDAIAGSAFPELADFQVDIPDALKAAIDARDGELITSLQLALQQIENTYVEPSPGPVQKLRGMLSNSITRFYPFSVVEVRFSKRGELDDSKAPAEVVNFDDEFSRLYGYVDKSDAELDRPLTLDRLLNRIEKFSDPDDWKKFMHEQIELTETVIKDRGFARATVPLRFNSSHTHAGFKCKSFLPCMAAKVIDGVGTELRGGVVNLDEPHQMYLLIAYIEVDNETAQLSTG